MAGRPTVKSEEVVRKIEECAALGSSIEEIAFYVGIHRATLYRWMEEDQELKDRIEELQERPILKARQAIVKALDEPEHAKWYLERKRKNEFSQRTEVENNLKSEPLDRLADSIKNIAESIKNEPNTTSEKSSKGTLQER